MCSNLKGKFGKEDGDTLSVKKKKNKIKKKKRWKVANIFIITFISYFYSWIKTK